MLLRPEKVRRRWLRGGGAPGGPCAPTGGWRRPREGSWRPSHVRSRRQGDRAGGCCSPAEFSRDKRTRGRRRGEAEMVAHAGKLGGSEDATAASSAAAPMVAALWHSRAGSGEREGASREWRGGWRGRAGAPPHRQQGAGRVAKGGTRGSGGGAWRPRTGRVSSVGAFSRTVGGRRRDQRGTRFWAISRPNQDLGRIRRSKPARSSTFFIKGVQPLAKHIRR